MFDREIILTTLDRTGHTTTKTMLSTLTKEKIMSPDRSILVNGEVCETWNEVLDKAKKIPQDQPVEIASIMKIVGG